MHGYVKKSRSLKRFSGTKKEPPGGWHGRILTADVAWSGSPSVKACRTAEPLRGGERGQFDAALALRVLPKSILKGRD